MHDVGPATSKPWAQRALGVPSYVDLLGGHLYLHLQGLFEANLGAAAAKVHFVPHLTRSGTVQRRFAGVQNS